MEFDVRTVPYLHAVCAAVLDPGLAETLLGRLEAQHWRLDCHAGYRFEIAAPDEIFRLLQAHGVLDDLRVAAQTIFRLDPVQPTVAIQRYAGLAEIAPHTDAGAHEARFVISVNRKWSIEHGGIWLLSRARDLSPPRRCLPPVTNTGFLFVPAANTFHSMTRMTAGVSHGVVVAFAASGARTAPHR